MQGILWLLLPVAAASGWYAATRNIRKSSPPGQSYPVPEFLQGLKYLLEEQPDRAVDLLTSTLEINSETIDTHLALGVLFRKRGETEQAIRIHQQLLDMPDPGADQREAVLLELGRDYMYAGLLDRAEELFSEQASMYGPSSAAMQHLLDIYQQQREWAKAAGIAEKLDKAGDQPSAMVLAHFYCEQAEQAREKAGLAASRKLLDRALETDQHCVRASVLRGDVAFQCGDYREAIDAYKSIVAQDIEFLPEVLDSLIKCHEHYGETPALIDYLLTVLDERDGISLVLPLTGLIAEYRGTDEAVSFVSERLVRNPSICGMAQLIELGLARCKGADRRYLALLKELSGSLLQGKPAYRCGECGFTGHSLHWRCPGCRRWGTVKPAYANDSK